MRAAALAHGTAFDESAEAPLEFLVAVMRNKALDLPVRIDAAKAAAPYLHPRLNMIDARLLADQSPSAEEEALRFAEVRRQALAVLEHAFRDPEQLVIEHNPLSPVPGNAAPAAERGIVISSSQPREFAAGKQVDPGPVEVDGNVERLPVRPRPPWPAGSG